MGMKRIDSLKKPAAFQLPSNDADDPSVQKALGLLGVGNSAKMPKPMQLVLAGLAFSNSDFAFQGTHLFQGNFYGVNFYDISNPASVSLITSLVCPGGQGDVSVYGHLLFMSVEMPNGRLDCGTQGFPPPPPPAAGHENERPHPAASPDRFRGVRIFDIADIKNPKQVGAVQTPATQFCEPQSVLAPQVIPSLQFGAQLFGLQWLLLQRLVAQSALAPQ